MSTINPDQLADEIMKTLEEYAEVTEEAAAAGVVETANTVVEELHNVTPPNGAPKYRSWNAYLADWNRKKLKQGKKGEYIEVVHNKKHYQLAHLLEYGHALWQGGRAEAYEHIAPIAERAGGTLLDNIKKHIKQS